MRFEENISKILRVPFILRHLLYLLLEYETPHKYMQMIRIFQ